MDKYINKGDNINIDKNTSNSLHHSYSLKNNLIIKENLDKKYDLIQNQVIPGSKHMVRTITNQGSKSDLLMKIQDIQDKMYYKVRGKENKNIQTDEIKKTIRKGRKLKENIIY